MFTNNPDRIPAILESPQVKKVLDAIQVELANPNGSLRKLTFLRAFASVMVVYMEAELPPDDALSLAAYLIAASAKRAAARKQMPFDEALQAVLSVVLDEIQGNPTMSGGIKAQA